jgi:hypothetical protein
MQDLRTLTFTQLVDLLAQQTSNYLKIVSDGSTEEEYARTNLTIRALQQEIENRKKFQGQNFFPDSLLHPPPEYSL